MSDENSGNKKNKSLFKVYISKILIFLAIALFATVGIMLLSKEFITEYVYKAENVYASSVDDININYEFIPNSLEALPSVKDYEIGKKLAVISCDNIGLNSDVYLGSDRLSMRYGSGLSTEFTLFGQEGVSYVTAYLESDFEALNSINEDDVINVTTEYGDFEYTVTEVSVEKPNELNFNSYDGDTLILSGLYPMLSENWENSLIVVAKSEGEVR